MKNEEAIEILEAMAMAESTFSDEESKKCCEAIDLAVEALKREEACFDEPLTLEQLREMKNVTPVWWEGAGFWCLAQNGGIVTPSGQCYDVEGLPGEFYEYLPAKIDWDSWEPCRYCKDLHLERVHVRHCGSGEVGIAAEVGKVNREEKTGIVIFSGLSAAGYVDFDFCPFCGRPQTMEARKLLEKRLRG